MTSQAIQTTIPTAIPASIPVGANAGDTTPPANTSGTLGKDDFMKLLVAQMQNQDPMDPLKGSDLAAQMAQFSSVEQLMNINATLTTQQTDSQAIASAINLSTATSALGKTITATGNSVAITTGDPASVTFDVGGSGGTAVVHILNPAGVEIGTKEVGTVGAGRQTVDIDTAGVPSGAYTYSVDVKDSTGAAVPVTTYTVGVADSIQYTPTGPVLGAGPISIPFGSIISIATKTP